jgi:phosphoglycolate phosphatase
MYDVILFDLDGTLTDPALGIVRSIQYALAKFDLVEDDTDKLKLFIGPPLIDSFRKSYGFSEAEARQAVEYYREYFSTTGIYENFIYPGIPTLLERLHSGRRLFVATSKPTVFARRIVEYFGIGHFFADVVGSNLDGTRCAKAEIIEHIMAALPRVSKKKVVMVGDREYDVIGAHANNIASIAVTYGYGTADELEKALPGSMAQSVEQLGKLLGLDNRRYEGEGAAAVEDNEDSENI